MGALYNTFLYQPFLKTLSFIYHNIAFEDLGFSIILLTLFIRILLFPLFYKFSKHQTAIQRLQPKVKKIQKDLHHDKEAQVQEIMKLYKDNKTNPFTGFLLLLIQIPILIAIYQVIYKEISNFDNSIFLSFINLRTSSPIIALISAILQYYQTKLSLPKVSGADSMAAMNKSMLVFGPALSFIILLKVPSALGLYWLTSTIFSLGQQLLINKSFSQNNDNRRNNTEDQNNN